MSKYQKLLQKILHGASDAAISFAEMIQLLNKLGFMERIKGDHHIFYKENIQEIINIQPKSGKAKPYQVKQIRDVILKYNLGETNV